jgi:hypothetical protein
METVADVSAHDALDARFERELARDRSLLELFDKATLLISIGTAVILLTLAIPMGRYSIWLALLPGYGVGTRLLVFVARYALNVPLFLLALDSPSPEAAAAGRVFESHRDEIARRLLTAGNHTPTDAEIAALTWEDAARRARERDLPGRRRTGVLCLAIWTVVTLVTWGIVIATGGGPSS